MAPHIAHHKRRRGVAVRPPRNHNAFISACNEIIGVAYRLQSGPGVALNRVSGHLHRKSRLEPGKVADIVRICRGVGLAKHHLIDGRRFHAGACEQLLNRRCRQVRG